MPEHPHDPGCDAADADGIRPETDATPAPARRRNRRVTTPPPPGSDPTPAPEPPRLPRGDNDERMRREKPPHY